jgi:apolipoprotein D and lipocalin family protein
MDIDLRCKTRLADRLARCREPRSGTVTMLLAFRLRSLLPMLALLLGGCIAVPVPEHASAVSNFEPERYLGTWYEIARLDHRFERGLEQVAASYSARDNGSIHVVNRGLESETGEWKKASGQASFIGARDRGLLKVSFFRPFYSAYMIFYLSADYCTAFVTGNDANTLWLLSRSPTVGAIDRARFVEAAHRLGVSADRIIWVPQKSDPAPRESVQ